MRLILAVLFGKLISSLTRLLNIGGGSAAPGLYALRIDPNLVQKLSSQIKKNVVITGTNGKTTTSRMLANSAKSAGLKVIRNHTGSNLERGIASALLQKTEISLSGAKLNFDLGIWELDEAAFNTVAVKLKPEIIVFLNLFRDQLDRYGEIDSVAKNWCQVLKSFSPKTLILVNGDDTKTVKIAECFKGTAEKFGVEDYKITGEGIKHLEENEELNFEAKNVKLDGLIGSSFDLTINNKQSLRSDDLKRLAVSLPLPGIYHIYDFLAGFAAGVKIGIDLKQIISSLKNYSPAFGRVEKLPFGYIFLIKNPAGATQVFETIAPQFKKGDRLLIALNDNLADGTDVSWIWDADFQVLHATGGKLQVICSGQRANDLAVRLKYSGTSTEQITTEPDLNIALRAARVGLKGRLFILPTYTAMLELQSILTRAGIKKHYWKENE